jgi:NRPS condensation-like uncharacterized protein
MPNFVSTTQIVRMYRYVKEEHSLVIINLHASVITSITVEDLFNLYDEKRSTGPTDSFT